MWDYDSFIGKAKVYFERAREHPRLDYEVLAIWLLLGLEFLLRAPLARISTTLLAEPDFALDAAGFPSPEGTEPKSIASKTVIVRLQRVVEGFTPSRATDANYLINIRNRELHTGSVAVGLDSDTWLPRFIRLVDVICAHLTLEPKDLIGSELLAQGRALVADEDKKLVAEVQKRIASARAHFQLLRPDEVATRQLDIPDARGQYEMLPGFGPGPSPAAGAAWSRIVAETGTAPAFIRCPACGAQAAVRLQLVRATSERLEDESIYRDIVFVGTGMTCVVCGLELSSTAEMHAAGLPQQYTREEEESLEERFGAAYEGEDYGND
ncbi:hypothetical protein [Rugosimonospora africana]|uniref:Uncharacterized protein n=1 Tax=Rugosimonospora africana TaxID=556532 RepID=A0A8J3VWT8_9ACTN|nr:hypothetical protein [Rugosimonospora africana]GIH21191.1 hypothetical protein Raf01_93630 [Rugosimonospora africana]